MELFNLNSSALNMKLFNSSAPIINLFNSNALIREPSNSSALVITNYEAVNSDALIMKLFNSNALLTKLPNSNVHIVNLELFNFNPSIFNWKFVLLLSFFTYTVTHVVRRFIHLSHISIYITGVTGSPTQEKEVKKWITKKKIWYFAKSQVRWDQKGCCRPFSTTVPQAEFFKA